MDHGTPACRFDHSVRDTFKQVMNDQIERGLAQIGTGQVVDLEALFVALERDLASGQGS